jgi:hypothetical protein
VESIVSESSESKSKRVFINHIKNNVWEQQFTVFFEYHSESLNIIEHMRQVKRKLRRDFRDSAILYRIGLKNVRSIGGFIKDIEGDKSVVMPYFTFFTSKIIKLSEIKNSIKQAMEVSIKVKGKVITEERLGKYIDTVRKHKPHNLKKYLAKENVNRIGLINKDELVPRVRVSTLVDKNSRYIHGKVLPKK